MEHIAYCDAKAKELQNLLNGSKTMLIRGAAGRKLPHGRVAEGEVVYLLENDSSGIIRAQGTVSNALHSDKLAPEESERVIEENMNRLKLTEAEKKRWTGKRYLCLIELKDVQEIKPFSYVRGKNMDDWITVESVKDIME